MKQGEPVSAARRKTCTVRCLQALTLALAAVAGAAATDHASGAITLLSPEVIVAAIAEAKRFENREVVEMDQDMDVRNEPSTAAAAASVNGASATSGASLSATVTADPAADALEVIAAGSISISASRNTPGDDIVPTSKTQGTAHFRQTFNLTERPYEYTIFADTETSVTQTPPGSNAQARVLFGSHFDQRINERGVLFSSGSLSGILTPGQYTISGQAAGAYDVGQADATFALSFELAAASRWVGPNDGAAPADGSFQVAGNWTAPIVPGAADVAVFDLPGTYTVDLDQDVTNKRLRANGTGVNVSLDLNGNDYVLDTISIGGLEGDSVSISFNDSSGPVSVAAAGGGEGTAPAPPNSAVARLRANLLNAGKGGFADVKIPIATSIGQISDGGKVNVRTGEGGWEVNDLTIGIGSTGLLDVSAGGSMTTKRVFLGEKAFFVGSALVNVRGQGTVWDSQLLVVGNSGNAVFNVESDALVTSRESIGGLGDAEEVVIGFDEGSTGLVDVSDASFIVAPGDVMVGQRGTGTLVVRNGGQVDVGSFFVGRSSTGVGTVKVESSAELRINGELRIGKLGTGRLIIDGGSVEQISSSTGFNEIGPNGVVEVRSGHFHDQQLLVVDGTIAIDRTDGSASLGFNSIQTKGRLTVGPGGRLLGHGTIRGKVEVSGGFNQFGGAVRPGTSPGTLTIDGDYEQTGGQLGIEIGGTAAGQFDVLAVTGDATVGGELLLVFIDGFAPHRGDMFKFLDVDGALGGAFDEIEVRNLLPGFQFDLRSDGDGLTMVALNDGVFIPEPATLAMFCAGILMILFRRFARRSVWR
jgi:T5SS/PEP-CTERM-associated repeat protein